MYKVNIGLALGNILFITVSFNLFIKTTFFKHLPCIIFAAITPEVVIHALIHSFNKYVLEPYYIF